MNAINKVSFAGGIKIAFKKYFNFRGVATRREYWFFILFTVLLSIVLSTLDQMIFPQQTAAMDALAAALENPAKAFNFSLMVDAINEDLQNSPTNNFASLFLAIPTLTAMVRRMRDAGFSAWFLLLSWVPLLTFIFTVLPTKRRLS